MLDNVNNSQSDVDKLLKSYAELLLNANLTHNLISRKTTEETCLRLIGDSLVPLDLASVNVVSPVLDVGSGNGIPGVPLKLAMPNLELTLLDSSTKKMGIMRSEILRGLGLDDVEVEAVRLEGYRPLRGKLFNTIVSRAMPGGLGFMLKHSHRLLNVGGELILWKGSRVVEELQEVDLSGWESYKLHRLENLAILLVLKKGAKG